MLQGSQMNEDSIRPPARNEPRSSGCWQWLWPRPDEQRFVPTHHMEINERLEAEGGLQRTRPDAVIAVISIGIGDEEQLGLDSDVIAELEAVECLSC